MIEKFYCGTKEISLLGAFIFKNPKTKEREKAGGAAARE
jgi:hypothetical protein